MTDAAPVVPTDPASDGDLDIWLGQDDPAWNPQAPQRPLPRRYWWMVGRKGAGWGVKVSVLLLYPVNFLLVRTKWHRLDRIPQHGPAILVLNHISVFDPVIMARMVWDTGRVPRFMIKSSLFRVAFLGALFRSARQIPVHRGRGNATRSIEEATAALAAGEVVIIYPEGTITNRADGWPMEAKTGVARIVLANPDVPVIPIGQWGAHKSLRKLGGKVPVLVPGRKIEVSVGEPIAMDDLHTGRIGAKAIREATERIMAAVTAEVAVLRNEEPPTP